MQTWLKRSSQKYRHCHRNKPTSNSGYSKDKQSEHSLEATMPTENCTWQAIVERPTLNFANPYSLQIRCSVKRYQCARQRMSGRRDILNIPHSRTRLTTVLECGVE